MPATPTFEELLAEREAWKGERAAWRGEREAWQKERRQLQLKASSAQGEIERLRLIIASLQHKLFGNRKSEAVDTAQLQLQLSGAEEALVVLEAKQQAGKLREQEAKAEAEPRPRRARFVFPEQVEEVTEILTPAEVLAEPEAYRQIGEEVTELLDIVPMKFIKKRVVRPYYVRVDKREQPPVCASLPPRVFCLKRRSSMRMKRRLLATIRM